MAVPAPFVVDPTAREPWAVPIAALDSLFYAPSVNPSVVPLFRAVAVLMALETILALGNVFIRWRRTGVQFYKVHGGYVVPQTAVLWCFCGAGFLAAGQAQAWLLIRIVQGGSYAGIYVARGLTWTFGTLQLFVQIWGLSQGSSFNSGATRSQVVPILPQSQGWTTVVNLLMIAVLPLVIFSAIMVPTILSEVSCMRQFNTFQTARKIANGGEQQWVAGGGIANSTVLEFYGELAKLSASNCEPIQHGIYGAFLFWESVEQIGVLACYLVLKRKLRAQINILRRSARTMQRLEGTDALPSAGGDVKTGSSSATSGKDTRFSFAPYPSYGGNQGLQVTATSHDKLGERERTQRHQERRAAALEKGVNQLQWITALSLLANAVYMAADSIIVSKRAAVQSDAFWFSFVNQIGLWNYVILAGMGFAILFAAGLDPGRGSFLGIPVNITSDVESSLSRSLPDPSDDSVPMHAPQSLATVSPTVGPRALPMGAGPAQDRWEAFSAASQASHGKMASPERTRAPYRFGEGSVPSSP